MQLFSNIVCTKKEVSEGVVDCKCDEYHNRLFMIAEGQYRKHNEDNVLYNDDDHDCNYVEQQS